MLKPLEVLDVLGDVNPQLLHPTHGVPLLQAFKTFAQGMIDGKLFYAPLLGWCIQTGREFAVRDNYPMPKEAARDMREFPWTQIGKDGLDGMMRICRMMGISRCQASAVAL